MQEMEASILRAQRCYKWEENIEQIGRDVHDYGEEERTISTEPDVVIRAQLGGTWSNGA